MSNPVIEFLVVLAACAISFALGFIMAGKPKLIVGYERGKRGRFTKALVK